MPEEQDHPALQRNSVRLFLCGDVMSGCGIDQVLAHRCTPRIYEDHMSSAEGYVQLAERQRTHPAAQQAAQVWGAASTNLSACGRTRGSSISKVAVTRSDERADKGIDYRMSPENAA